MEILIAVELGLLVIFAFSIESKAGEIKQAIEDVIRQSYSLQKTLESVKEAVIDLKPARQLPPHFE